MCSSGPEVLGVPKQSREDVTITAGQLALVLVSTKLHPSLAGPSRRCLPFPQGNPHLPARKLPVEPCLRLSLPSGTRGGTWSWISLPLFPA